MRPYARLIKRVKRAAFGFTNFDNYRIRALLYAGKPNWALLETLTPTLKREEPVMAATGSRLLLRFDG